MCWSFESPILFGLLDEIYMLFLILTVAGADKHAKWIEKEMTGAIKLDVPLKVDITSGLTWLSDM